MGGLYGISLYLHVYELIFVANLVNISYMDSMAIGKAGVSHSVVFR